MTTLEHFSALAMQGLISNAPDGQLGNSKEGAQLAVKWAKDLISVLKTEQCTHPSLRVVTDFQLRQFEVCDHCKYSNQIYP